MALARPPHSVPFWAWCWQHLAPRISTAAPYTGLSHPLRQVGAALETSGFYPGRTARDHLRILALAAGVDSSRADDALDIVDLSSAANQRIGGFSLGMRQRLGLAGALIANPEILILDEPANGLDPEGVRWLRDLLRGYAADGGTVWKLPSSTSQTRTHGDRDDPRRAGRAAHDARGGRQVPRGVRRTMKVNLPPNAGAPAAIARAPGS
jgi:ABC-2 type transport system ATP-binding protein